MSLFHAEIFFKNLLSWDYFLAALTTLWISLASLLLGLLVGLILAIARDSGVAALDLLAKTYLWLFRGTPVLLQIVFAFYVLPSFGIVLSRFTCAVLALGLNEGAYIAEIIRAGLRAVGEDQREAARALGLKPWHVMRLVVLPQAFRIIIPPIGNQFISMLKLTALVEVIGVRELLLVASQAASSNFRYLEALSAAGIYYLALTTMFMAVQSRIEQAFGSGSNKAKGRAGRLDHSIEPA
jgi:polar amino acid transport system permease protein